MKMFKAATVIAVCAVVSWSTGAVEASDITVDPDAFPIGTVLNDAYPGVTLTAPGDSNVLPNSNVLALASQWVSTGSNAFGNSEPRRGDAWGNENFDYLRADFAMGALTVSLDFISNDDSGDQNAVLKAFDSLGVLVDMDITDLVPGGEFVTLTVSAPYIARVHAEWDNINRIENGALDCLTYEPVPEPATVALLGLGSLVLLHRRKK